MADHLNSGGFGDGGLHDRAAFNNALNMENDNKKKRSFLAKGVIFLGAAVLVFAGIASYKEISKKKQIQAEIEKLSLEAEKISRENALTQEKIAYLESPDFKEKEAKDKLNLQNLGENVVIVKPTVASKDEVASSSPAAAVPNSPEISNFIKWWNYFFKS